MSEWKHVEFVVEASSYEQQSLWERFAKQNADRRPDKGLPQIDWQESTRGSLIQVGELDARPVNIVVFVHFLNGHAIMFYEAVSQVIDYAQIESWFRDHCWPLWDSGTRRAHCDAMNFHHCLEVVTSTRK